MMKILLCTNGSQRSTDAFVASISVQPGSVLLCLGVALPVHALQHAAPPLLDAEPPGAGSSSCSAPTRVATIHVSVGLPHLVQHSPVVHALVCLSWPHHHLPLLLGTILPGAGAAPLPTLALVTTILSNVTIIESMSGPSHILTLVQHCNILNYDNISRWCLLHSWLLAQDSDTVMNNNIKLFMMFSVLSGGLNWRGDVSGERQDRNNVWIIFLCWQ